MEELDYNSSRPDLIISEYGRNIQKLIEHTKTIEDDEKRQQTAEYIIMMMHQMVPTDKGIQEQEDSLWKHFFRIAGHDINVTPPEGVNVRPKAERYEIEKLDYPQKDHKFKHYGSLIQQMIEEAKVMPEGPKREYCLTLIASYMKMAYRTWNQEHFVNDDMIRQDLKHISGGTLVPDDETNMNFLSSAKRSKNYSSGRSGSGGSKNNNRRKNSGGGRGKNNNRRRSK